MYRKQIIRWSLVTSLSDDTYIHFIQKGASQKQVPVIFIYMFKHTIKNWHEILTLNQVLVTYWKSTSL